MKAAGVRGVTGLARVLASASTPKVQGPVHVGQRSPGQPRCWVGGRQEALREQPMLQEAEDRPPCAWCLVSLLHFLTRPGPLSPGCLRSWGRQEGIPAYRNREWAAAGGSSCLSGALCWSTGRLFSSRCLPTSTLALLVPKAASTVEYVKQARGASCAAC